MGPKEMGAKTMTKMAYRLEKMAVRLISLVSNLSPPYAGVCMAERVGGDPTHPPKTEFSFLGYKLSVFS